MKNNKKKESVPGDLPPYASCLACFIAFAMAAIGLLILIAIFG